MADIHRYYVHRDAASGELLACVAVVITENEENGGEGGKVACIGPFAVTRNAQVGGK